MSTFLMCNYSFLISIFHMHVITSESDINPTNHATTIKGMGASRQIRSTAASSLEATVIGMHTKVTSLVRLSIQSRVGTGNSELLRVSTHYVSTALEYKKYTTSTAATDHHTPYLTAAGECKSHFTPSSISYNID